MKIQVFGNGGFVETAFTKKSVDRDIDYILNEKNDYEIKSNQVVYMISTITNYNVFKDPYLDINTNLITLIKVLENCKEVNNLTFNFISSWFVYGKTDVPAYENTFCNPTGFYSITKRCAEQLLISFCKTFNIKYRILRLANVVGKGDKKVSSQKNALQFIINEMKANKDVSIYDDGKFNRDYIHVEDASNAIHLVISKGKINNIYNVSNGEPVLFKNIIKYAKQKIKSKSKLISIPTPEFHKNVQIRNMWMNSDKLFELGYVPKYKIEDIINDMIYS